jgi:arsenate reductase (thioredoxin)
MTGEKKTPVLFLCAGNSCRSRMAEGLARQMGAGVIEAYSAGTNPAGINPRAVQAQ